MKATFNTVLEAARAERAVVIEAFMKAYEQVLILRYHASSPSYQRALLLLPAFRTLAL